ncbi:MAG: hypothetical protein ACKKMR_01290 [Candidatus Nealsonbacteria bacterium]
MKTKFTQRDYILYLRYYEKVLKFFKKEMEEIESSGKKTLWYHGAQETLERLKKEEGKNLTPQDVDNIIYVLLDQLEEKQN